MITPLQLLACKVSAERENAILPFRALNILKDRWKQLDHAWGPGGSVGFELATRNPVVKTESDLDIVLYLARRMTTPEAQSLYAQVADLPAAVDVRVETVTCGFSLAEFARAGSARILLRTLRGLVLGDDPWRQERKMSDGMPDDGRLKAS